MLDPLVLRLLEDVVNTSCKLSLVLLFAENNRLSLTSQQIALRLARDPWSVEAAIRELTRDNILEMRDGKVCYRPHPEWQRAINLLRVVYDDPYQRETVKNLVHDLERYAPYRDELLVRNITVLAF